MDNPSLSAKDNPSLSAKDNPSLSAKDNPSLSKAYLKSLTEMELIAYNIAKSHLGSLFTLEKSNHYLEWLSKHHRG
jgi:hypothetical protein